MAIAYLLGKGSSMALHTKVNIPLLLVLSIIPDVDIIFDYLTGAQIHRGPTHSIVVAALIFTPLFIHYGKQAIPYFLALISHFVIADFFIGGQLQLFWPLTTQQFGAYELGFYYISIWNPINILTEIMLFATAMAILYKTGDWRAFFKADKLNLVLFLPIVCVLLPSTIGYPFDGSLLFRSPLLAFAHLVFLALFTIAVYKTLISIYHQWFCSEAADSSVG
jgi:hypothetical protein